MRFRVLGPLEVQAADGGPVEVGSPKLRALLTLLLAEAGRVVTVDRIVDELWGDAPPPTAAGTLQTYVSHLRRLVGRDTVLTRAPGYLAAVDADDLDLLRLPRLVEQGARLLAEGAPDRAEAVLAEALGLWRGEPLVDLDDADGSVAAERARLAELKVSAAEQLATARLRAGRPDLAVADLERLVAEHPLRERLWARLAEGLYACGRQAEALGAVRACGRRLREDLGLDPGAELRELEEKLLAQHPSLQQPVPAQRTAEAPSVHADDERPLVGRRAERARLRTALAEVTRGSGAVVVLEGEAGIGKTRLAESVTALAVAQGWRAAWSRCADDAGAPALWPWTQLLEQLGAGGLTVPADGDPDRSRFSLFQDLRARLAQPASGAPLLVVVDDVQAADATSVQLLQLLSRHLDGIRLLVVVTVRTVGEELPSVVAECLAALGREPRAQRLQLAGLGAGDVRELVAATLGDADDVGGRGHDDLSDGGQDELSRQVHARTGGNPFFVVELVELLRAERRLDSAGPSLPPSVRDVLERRLARLPQDTVDLLRLAAVIGRDAELGLLEAAGGMDAEAVITRLEPAVDSGIVGEDDVAWSWRFRHALVQETLLAGLSRLDAARRHAAVGQALEARGGQDVARLAHHFFHAVPLLGAEPAVRYATAAAKAARARLAHAEAAAHSRRALTLLSPATAPGERHAVLVSLAEDLLRSGDVNQAQVTVAEALDLARAMGDVDRLAEAASVWGGVTLWNWRPYGMVDEPLVRLLEDLAERAGDRDPALQARLLGTLGVELAYSERRAAGVAAATLAVGVSHTTGEAAVLGRALNNYSLVTWGSDDRVERRLAAADEALALAGHGLPARTEFYALLHRGPLRLHLGDVTGFEADLAAATRIGASLTGPEVRPHLIYEQAGRAMVRGDWALAEELAVQARVLLGSTSMWGAQCCAALHTYTFRRREGRVGDALDQLVEGGDELGVPLLQVLAVVAAAEAGDREEARRLQRRWPAASPRDWTTDALVVARAELALRLGGDVDDAYGALLPYTGRLVVVGTATSFWGPYDDVLSRLADARGDALAADEHRRRSARLLADAGLAPAALKA
jgi:DNA-binding SARP family transcriptional activator